MTTAFNADLRQDTIDRLFMLPEELKQLKQFLLWKFHHKKGEKKPRKIPYYTNGTIRHGIQGGPEDVSRLATFKEALEALESGHYDGIGLAKLDGDGLIGLDLDNCLIQRALTPEVAPLIDGTYAEVSPSGNGVRAFYLGAYKDCKDHELGVEIFCGKGFLTVTGDVLNAAPIIPLPVGVKQRLDTTIFNHAGKFGNHRHSRIAEALRNDPIYRELKSRGLVRKDYGDGRIGFTCPFEEEHTTEHGDGDCVYFLPHTNGYAYRHFHCFHAHCENREDHEFLTALGLKEHVTDFDFGPSQEWEDPIPFDSFEAPPIRPDLLPEPLKSFCMAVAESIQVPFELPLMAALGAVAAAAQGKYKVDIKDGYSEPLSLYILGVLPPGERKSATVAQCKMPLSRWEMDQAVKMAPEIQAAASERLTIEKAIASMRNKAGSGKIDLGKVVRDVKDLEDSLPEIPVPPRLFIDDSTPEALAAFMGKHNNRAANLDAEGGIFENISGLYSNAKMPNLNIWLKAWSGESVTVDRRTSETVYVQNPALTLCLCLLIQPEVLHDIGGKPGFRGRGLLGRFLYLLPNSRLGRRRIETEPIPYAVESSYAQMLLRLAEAPWEEDENNHKLPSRIKLSGEAFQLWVEFATQVESELGNGGLFADMTDWAGKIPGQAVRLAGLYHVARTVWPASEPISLSTMEMALELAAMLTEHARIAFGQMGANLSAACALKLLKWITSEKIELFSARDALNIVKGDHRFNKMEQVRSGLEILVDRCFIRPMISNEKENQSYGDGKKKRGRKPSQMYEVNPLAHNSQNSQK